MKSYSTRDLAIQYVESYFKVLQKGLKDVSGKEFKIPIMKNDIWEWDEMGDFTQTLPFKIALLQLKSISKTKFELKEEFLKKSDNENDVIVLNGFSPSSLIKATDLLNNINEFNKQ